MNIPKDPVVAISRSETQCADCQVRERALFQGIRLDQLQWTQHYREKQIRVKARTPLFDEGKDHPYAYTLYSGWIMLSKTLASGRRQILRFALPGDFLGFLPVPDGPMNCSAYTLTDCKLCAFPKEQVDAMMHENPHLAARMAQLNARDLAFLQQVLLATGQKNARERLASLLLQLYIRVRALGVLVPDTTENSIALPLSQEKLADAVGMSKEHVNRTLRDLREEHLLEFKSRRLTVFDVDRLMEIADMDPEAVAEQALL